MYNPTSQVPIGGIIPWAKTITGVPSLPAGWLECNGATISDVGSPMDGQTIPDLNSTQRFLRGAGTSGGTGGSDTHQLTEAEMPSHTHAITPQALGVGGAANTDPIAGFTYDKATLVAASTGGDTAHENKPAYYQVVWIIRIK